MTKITETVLRDGHQCLIATRLRTEDMLPICNLLDQVGYGSLEVWGGATFDACLRFLAENPWDRLRLLRKALPNTPLQMLLRGQNILGYRHYADDIVEKFVEKSADNGMDIFRIFDALNDTRNLKTAIKAVKKYKKHAQGAISYTTSPVHTIEHFVSVGMQLADMGCDSLAIKDMAGLLTPYKTEQLVKALKPIGLPLQLHTHATAGLSEMCMLKAIENGCEQVDTAISAFSGGASHAPTESIVAALKDTPYDTNLNLELLQDIGFYFHEIRKKYKRFESEYTGLDTRVQSYQVPGGMISNLSNQLKEQNALDRFADVLKEIPKVREDLGYPPLVTPTSQIVGAQAVLNVLTQKRYQTISNEVKQYLKGHYGASPAPVNQALQDMVLTQGEKVITNRPADQLKPEFEKLKQAYKDLTQDEETLLMLALFPDIAKNFLEGNAVAEVLEIPEEKQNIPVEFNISLHGNTHHIKLTGAGHKQQATRPFYVVVDGITEEVLIETLGEIQAYPSQDSNTSLAKQDRNKATKPGHVTTFVPASIVEVLVKEGDNVSAGQAVLITEAMKMENEIEAPISGVVKQVLVKKGDRVNPNEILIAIEG